MPRIEPKAAGSGSKFADHCALTRSCCLDSWAAFFTPKKLKCGFKSQAITVNEGGTKAKLDNLYHIKHTQQWNIFGYLSAR